MKKSANCKGPGSVRRQFGESKQSACGVAAQRRNRRQRETQPCRKRCRARRRCGQAGRRAASAGTPQAIASSMVSPGKNKAIRSLFSPRREWRGVYGRGERHGYAVRDQEPVSGGRGWVAEQDGQGHGGRRFLFWEASELRVRECAVRASQQWHRNPCMSVFRFPACGVHRPLGCNRRSQSANPPPQPRSQHNQFPRHWWNEWRASALGWPPMVKVSTASAGRHSRLCPAGSVQPRGNGSFVPEGIFSALPRIQEGAGGPAALCGFKGQKKVTEKSRGTIDLQRQNSGQPLSGPNLGGSIMSLLSVTKGTRSGENRYFRARIELSPALSGRRDWDRYNSAS